MESEIPAKNVEMPFKDLKMQDYSENPREQVKYVGQKSEVRFFDPHDRMDALGLKEMLEAPNTVKWMEDLRMNEKDYIKWMHEKGPAKNRRHFLFTVSGSETKSENVGEAEGFVYFYKGSKESKQAQRLVEEGILKPEELVGKRIMEISYARSPDSPPGRMTGGIMQSCVEVSKIIQRKKDVDPKNILILAYTDPENSLSERVIQEGGFKKIGMVSGYGEGNQTPNNVFRLDWDSLDEKMHSSQSLDALRLALKPRQILQGVARP